MTRVDLFVRALLVLTEHDLRLSLFTAVVGVLLDYLLLFLAVVLGTAVGILGLLQ